MKIKNIILIGLAAVGLALSAKAQLGNDVYFPNRTYVLMSPTQLAVNSTTTNGPIDHINIVGRSVINVSLWNTNASANVTLLPMSSVDGTNYVAIPNFAYVTAQSYSITNEQYGSTGYNHVNTQSVLSSAQITPTPYTALFAGIPYFGSLQFTNTAAVTATASGDYQLVFNVSDASRYIALQVVSSATSGTNEVVGATLQGSVYNGGQY